MNTPARWRGFRSVLCPVDFSEQSRLALRYANAIAQGSRARLRVMYVNEPLLVAAARAALHDRELVARSAAALRQFTAATVGRAAQRRGLTLFVKVGAPAEEILKAAKQCRCDLIVLGTHGLTGANRLLMGSVSSSVLRRASVPVLAVPRSRVRDRRGSPLWPPR